MKNLQSRGSGETYRKTGQGKGRTTKRKREERREEPPRIKVTTEEKRKGRREEKEPEEGPRIHRNEPGERQPVNAGNIEKLDHHRRKIRKSS